MTQPKFQGKYRIESIRLPNRDYAANGLYFVTICTSDRICFFGNVVNGEMQLSTIGKIAHQFWADIPNHFEHTYIDAFVIMPNHVHGVIVIDRPTATPPVETRNFASLHRNFASLHTDQSNKFAPLKPGSLPTIIHAYKSAVTRWCRKNNFNHFGWQPRYYERIIRADGSLERIQKYIINNPAKWGKDKNNSADIWM